MPIPSPKTSALPRDSMAAAASGGAGAARGDDEWLRAYGRLVAMLPRVEALAAGRAQLEAVNALQHEFWEARDALIHHQLLQVDESRRMWQAAYIDLQSSGSGDDRKLAELQESHSEDLSTFVHVLAAENTEFQIKLKEVDAGAEHSQNAADHEHVAEDLKAELRKLKQGYEALCSEKVKEISALVEENDLLRDQFRTLKRDYADFPTNMKKEATQATEARQELQQNLDDAEDDAQDDAEAEHFEPMVTYKDAEEMLGNAYCSHGANPNIVEHESSIQREESNNCPPATPASEPHQETSPILSNTSEPDNSKEAWSSQDAEDVAQTPVHVSRTIESHLQQVPVYGIQPLEFLEKTPNTSDELTAPIVMNISTPSSNLGSSLVPGFHAKKKNSLKHHRNVKPPCPIDNEHSLGVEGRLNSLLDQDGGISTQIDSINEYMRLLLVTSVDGDAAGTSKSIRDISLILKALLQTKSRAVLLDIINLNGLHMLHNILKQNRDHFLRRPIIRKLLKVFEFLALRGILTAEKINEGPQCAWMESFQDSMLKLTRHSDKHVHSIARKFCEKWIIPYVGAPASCGTHSHSSGRKRKSRWDHQPESRHKMVGL